nr:hypothetical protein [Ruminococcus sp. OA3]
MTSISGYLDDLVEGIADTPEKRMRYLQAIQTRTGNLVSLVDSLSEYSRLDNGFRYHMEASDFREFVEHYLETLRPDAEQKASQCVRQVDSGASESYLIFNEKV